MILEKVIVVELDLPPPTDLDVVGVQPVWAIIEQYLILAIPASDLTKNPIFAVEVIDEKLICVNPKVGIDWLNLTIA